MEKGSCGGRERRAPSDSVFHWRPKDRNDEQRGSLTAKTAAAPEGRKPRGRGGREPTGENAVRGERERRRPQGCPQGLPEGDGAPARCGGVCKRTPKGRLGAHGHRVAWRYRLGHSSDRQGAAQPKTIPARSPQRISGACDVGAIPRDAPYQRRANHAEQCP